jgi:hypothetical protein
LINAGVEFFDTEKTLPPLFVLKGATDEKDVDFDNDESISTLFEFDEGEEEYFDASGDSSHETTAPETGKGSEDDDDPGEF